MQNVKSLACLLDRQVEIHKNIMLLECKKTAVLVEGDVEQLDSFVNTALPLMMSSRNLEKQREELQAEIGLKGFTLRQIIDKLPGSGELLESRLNDLRDIAFQIKKVNRTNQRILNSRLSVLDFVLSKSGISSGEPVTYKKP